MKSVAGERNKVFVHLVVVGRGTRAAAWAGVEALLAPVALENGDIEEHNRLVCHARKVVQL